MENGVSWSFYHDVLTAEPRTRYGDFLKCISSAIEGLVEAEKQKEQKPKSYPTDRTIFAPCDMFSVIAALEPQSVLSYDGKWRSLHSLVSEISLILA
jgi:hypothetical protein